MLKKIFLSLLILIVGLLNAEKLNLRASVSGTAYYPSYTSYHYESPVIGVRLNAEGYNLLDQIGIGGTINLKLKSYDERIDQARFIELYLHNFYAYQSNKEYFIYGFYGGFRNSKLAYDHYKTGEDTDLNMTRVLLGFKFARESWGFDLNWSQAEDRKPILGYELKFRNSQGVTIHLGRHNCGPMIGADSDFYIYVGYEFFM
ncbi:MAG TPA: hypothetical protein PLD62_00915 [Candidatus Cloacimonadota bacterium]|nr:hypothetical protein [Candidatus Cloacimonadota bacterium]